MTEPATIEQLQDFFPDLTASEYRSQSRVAIASEELYELLGFLKIDLGFDYLIDITCVDYLNYREAEHRFGLVYILCNTKTNEQIIVRTYLDEPNLTILSAVSLWSGANWMEREVWDMFGITFEEHPDHRRILLPEEFEAHPLRKDYPLQGKGERHQFPALARDGTMREPPE